MKNLKIDVITKYFYPVAAGIETNTLETYKFFAKRGWDTTIHTSKDTYLKKNTLKASETIQGLKVKRYNYPSDLKGYMPDIDWNNTDVIALHNFNVSHVRILIKTLWLKITKKKKFVLIITPHGGFNPDWSIFNLATRIKKILYQYTVGMALANTTADGFRAVSNWEKEQMIKMGLNPKKIKVITNGLEDEAYKNVEKLATVKIKKLVDSFGKYIIQIGRIYPIKNYETTIKALPLVDPKLNYIIVGTVADEAYLKKLKLLAKELGVENRIFFPGVIRGVDKYYLIKKAAMMVHMANWESFCNVVHEGMSQGLVCVVANNTALKHLVKNNINGFKVETKDHKVLAKTINFVLDNSQSKAIKSIKLNNLKISKGASWKSVSQKMQEFYTDLIQSKIRENYGKN